jgi:hypothetical protein
MLVFSRNIVTDLEVLRSTINQSYWMQLLKIWNGIKEWGIARKKRLQSHMPIKQVQLLSDHLSYLGIFATNKTNSGRQYINLRGWDAKGMRPSSSESCARMPFTVRLRRQRDTKLKPIGCTRHMRRCSEDYLSTVSRRQVIIWTTTRHINSRFYLFNRHISTRWEDTVKTREHRHRNSKWCTRSSKWLIHKTGCRWLMMLYFNI